MVQDPLPYLPRYTGKTSGRAPDKFLSITLLRHLGLFDIPMYNWILGASVVSHHQLSVATSDSSRKQHVDKHRTSPSDAVSSDCSSSSKDPHSTAHGCGAARESAASPPTSTAEDVQPLLLVAPVPLLIAASEVLLNVALHLSDIEALLHQEMLVLAAPAARPGTGDSDSTTAAVNSPTSDHCPENSDASSHRCQRRIRYGLALLTAWRRFLGLSPVIHDSRSGLKHSIFDGTSLANKERQQHESEGAKVEPGLSFIFQLQSASGSMHAYKATVRKVSRKLSILAQGRGHDGADVKARNSIAAKAAAALPHYIRCVVCRNNLRTPRPPVPGF